MLNNSIGASVIHCFAGKDRTGIFILKIPLAKDNGSGLNSYGCSVIDQLCGSLLTKQHSENCGY